MNELKLFKECMYWLSKVHNVLTSNASLLDVDSLKGLMDYIIKNPDRGDEFKRDLIIFLRQRKRMIEDLIDAIEEDLTRIGD